MERRLINVNQHSIRKELELFVFAYNTPLKDVIPAMDHLTLLRNANPTYRSDFAYRMKDAKLITVEQCKEFVKLVR